MGMVRKRDREKEWKKQGGGNRWPSFSLRMIKGREKEREREREKQEAGNKWPNLFFCMDRKTEKEREVVSVCNRSAL